MSRFSINERTTAQWTFDEDVVNYLALGVEAIGVRRDKIINFGEERSIELIQDMAINVSSVFWGGGFTGADGYSHRESIDDVMRGIQLAAALSSPVIVVGTGPRGGHTVNHSTRLVLDALQELIPVAREEGIIIGLEPLNMKGAEPWTFLTRLTEIQRLLDDVDDPQVQFVFDPGYLASDLDRICNSELVQHVCVVRITDFHSCDELNRPETITGYENVGVQEALFILEQSGFQGFYEFDLMSESHGDSVYQETVKSCLAISQSILSDYSGV